MKRKRTSENKTSPLFEAIPQVMAILGTEDCLIGRQGRKEFAYDYCQPISWDQLPSLKATASAERELARKRGLDTKYWDDTLELPENILNRPSAYYSAIPFGHTLYKALPICGKDILIKTLVATYVRESRTERSSFDSVRNFSSPFIEVLKEFSDTKCYIAVETGFKELNLL